MLKRPTRPLPRKFNRPVSPQTRTFVERRHKRATSHNRERWRRWLLRCRAVASRQFAVARKWMKPLLLGLGILLVCLFLFSPVFHVREIRVIRTEGRVDLPKVLDAVAPLYGRHLLFLPVRDVSAKVREVIPDAVSITVSKRYPSQISVRISLSPIVARVRIESGFGSAVSAGTGTLVSGSGAAAGPQRGEFLTQNGLLVSAPPPSATDVLPTIRIIDWGVRPAPGSMLLTPEFFDEMRRAENILTLEFGQQLRTRTVYLRAREFHLDGPVVSYWFDMKSPLESQIQRLRTFLKTVKLTDVKNYVDLRLTGRVVYK